MYLKKSDFQYLIVKECFQLAQNHVNVFDSVFLIFSGIMSGINATIFAYG